MEVRSSLYTFILCMISLSVTAGNGPCSATPLSASSTDFTVFDNLGSTDSGIEAPPFGGYTGADFWFSFIMPAGELSLLLQSGSMDDPALAVYSGDCNDPLLIYNVIDNNCNGGVSPELLINELNIGEEYYIRVWAQGGSNNGNFGIFLGTDVPTLLSFEVYDDASIIGDCIELTPEANTQQGCAWYQLEIDFTQPFTHEMIANFGSNGINGADGICLVYQTNGPDFCGVSGAGIGAEGMPNSAIFEFDTYQNGFPYNDPFFDHVSFNVNGNMTHPASINGPVTLFPNIEDGNDHNILFNWNPAGNLYELYFDGNLVLSGSYDIINNCFGGNPLAYWGYTASTGASDNQHVICPLNVEYEPAQVSYEEVIICPGESYLGYTEPGFYISEETDFNGCTHQMHTRLTLFEESIPYELEKYICDGETFEVEGNIYFEEGTYTIWTQTENGCDSIINLDLKVIIPTLEIEGDPTLRCNRDSIWLTVNFDVNYPIADVDFFWSTPDGSSQSDSILATSPGLYTVNTFINYEDVLCQVGDQFQLDVDTVAPILAPIDDLIILCNTPASDRLLVAPTDTENLAFNWYYDEALVGTGDTLAVTSEGEYVLVGTDTVNGCVDTTTATVIIDGDIPVITLEVDTLTLNCQHEEYTLDAMIQYQEPGSISWDKDGVYYSEELMPSVSTPGLYTLNVIDTNGCITNDSIRILQDTTAPIIIIDDIIIPCDVTSFTINPITTNEDVSIVWDGPFTIENISSPTFDMAGTYTVEVTDTINQCVSVDTLSVDVLGPSPVINIEADTVIDCNNTEQLIEGNVDQNDASITWYNASNIAISNDENITVYDQDTYTIEAISSTGCMSLDSIIITENIIFPDVSLTADTIDCDNLFATVDATIINGTIDNWITADGSNPTTSSISTEVAGVYTINTINVETGCRASESIQVIDQSNPPVFTFNNNTITCNDPEVVLDLAISSAYESVTWTFPDSNTTNSLTPITDQSGEYSLHIEVEGSCDIDTNIIISIDTISPSFDISYGILDCNNPQTNLNLTNTENIDIITIESPNGTIYNAEENMVNEGGIYQINTIAANGCTTANSVEIESLITTPEVEIEQDDLVTCAQPEATLTAVSANPNIMYMWIDSNESSLGTGNEISVIAGGSYTLNIIDENGCSNSYDILVDEQLSPPDLNLTTEEITCDYPTANLTFESNSTIATSTWSDGNIDLSSEANIAVNSSGWYYVEATDEYGCIAIDSVEVIANITEPDLELISEDTITIAPGGMASISVADLSTENSTYIWMPSDGLSCVDCLQPNIEFFVSDEYTLTATNSYGCTSTLSVFVIEKKLTEVVIPNIFSPSNDDGNNDEFTLYGNENVTLINEMYVYDRWGNLVYSNFNFPPNQPQDGWDGSYKGSNVTNGVYVYVFRVSTIDGETLTYTGDITKI